MRRARLWLDRGMRQLVTAVSLAITLALAACGGKSTPAPAAPMPEEPAAGDPELVCCTIASADEMMSSMVPLDDCPEENRTSDACGNE